MKLWKLEGVVTSHTYGQTIVVLAEDESRARTLAKRHGFSNQWMNPTLTSCTQIPLEKELVLYAP